MKKILLYLWVLLSHFSFKAQSTLWGSTSNGGQYGFGSIYRTDSIGNNLNILHSFDKVHDGVSPGPIMQASDGKLYGMTQGGGAGVTTVTIGSYSYTTQGGTLFVYDPVLDSFKVLIAFNSTDPQYPTGFYNPSQMKLIEASPGILWGVFTESINNMGSPARYIMAYSIATNSLTLVATVPSWNTPSSTDTQYTGLDGTLYKASDGFIYGTTYGYSACATLADIQTGAVVRIDPATNAFSFIYPFTCNFTDGYIPTGNLEDVGGKLYSYTNQGGSYVYYPNMGYGVIYEYDPSANTYTKKYDLAGGTSGLSPTGYQLKGTNGKLYGTALGGANNDGLLYEYDITGNVFTKKLDFIDLFTPPSLGPFGQLWLVSSANGKIYGTTRYGIFEYNTNTNQTRIASRFVEATYNTSFNPIIEVCRKPAYHYNAVTSYTICTGSFFSYNLSCSNAQAFVWKHNGTTDASQNTTALQFNHIATTDAGNWVCEMTNACGTTTTALSLVVNPAGSGVVTSTITAIGSTSICPASTLTLSGNSGGTWNTGASTNAIIVSNPGAYQVVNTNACGQTFSNIIPVDTIASPAAAIISFPIVGTNNGPVLTAYMCPGDSLLLSGNTNGVWNTGQTSYSIYVHDLLPHYVTTSTMCKSITSATAQASYSPIAQAPVINPAGLVQICTGDSVLLNATGSGGSTAFNWYTNGSYFAYGSHIYVKQSGNYYTLASTSCGIVTSQTVQVIADSMALDTAIITPLSSVNFCAGGSVILKSNYSSCTWNTGDTTSSITVTQPGTYQVTNHNGCSSVTSVSVITTTIALPAVTYAEPNDSVCLSTPSYTLAPGSPAGGSYSGAGVSGTVFNPAIAGSGMDTVVYYYQDVSTGCVGKALQHIYVDYNPVIAIAGSPTICAGNNAVLYQTLYPPMGTWNTGQTGSAISVTLAGTYYVTKTDICGNSVSSNSIQITVNPAPTAPLITQAGNVLQSSLASSYQWYLNGVPISGATSQTYTVTQDGNYTVWVTGANGCYAILLAYAYTITGVEVIDSGNLAVQVFPNPSTGSFNLVVPPGAHHVNIVVRNTIGQIVYAHTHVTDPYSDFILSESGVYFIEITVDNKTYVKKLIVSAE